MNGCAQQYKKPVCRLVGADAMTPNSSGEPETVTGMGTACLEAFSDGVIAIIITIMMLELKAPDHPGIGELLARWHIFAICIASFTFVAIY